MMRHDLHRRLRRTDATARLREVLRRRRTGSTGTHGAIQGSSETLPSRGLSWAGHLGLVAFGFTLAACGPEADTLAPPTIHYGEDVCDACMMIISEERHAAATIVDVDGANEPRKFDDIGDLLDYHGRRPEMEVLAWYVHDYETVEWLDALSATYVVSEDLVTPMGHGIVAFADPARAESFAAEHAGEILDFDALWAIGMESAGADHGPGSMAPSGEHGSTQADDENSDDENPDVDPNENQDEEDEG